MQTAETSPERRQPLSKERVIQTAVALADREGIDSLSMRRLAQALGVAAMTLYHYVPNKEELLDGMVEVVFAEIAVPASDGEWRTALRARAVSTRAALNRHPWAIGLLESRRTPGPESMRLHNDVLGCLREAGFSIELAVHAYSVQDAYIYGFAQQEKSVPFESPEEITAVIADQVKNVEESPDLGALADEYPYIAEVVVGHIATSGYDFRDEFEYGLDLILDALERRRLHA
jgi:AcrR family transcriptional regulator